MLGGEVGSAVWVSLVSVVAVGLPGWVGGCENSLRLLLDSNHDYDNLSSHNRDNHYGLAYIGKTWRLRSACFTVVCAGLPALWWGRMMR